MQWEILLVDLGNTCFTVYKEISTHLTGRHSPIEMYLFSFKVYLNYFKIENNELSTTEEIAQVKYHFNNYLIALVFKNSL